MPRKSLAALLACLMLSAACSLPVNLSQIMKGAQNQPAITEAETSTAVPAGPDQATGTAAVSQPTSPAMVLTVKEFHEKSVNPKYQLDAHWPYLEWNGDPRADAFNKAAEAYATGEVQRYKESFLTTPVIPEIQDLSSSVDVNFVQKNETNGILSIQFKVYFYAAGAAHPGHYSSAINYDLRQGRVIALADLFKPGADYLNFISTTCIADLKARDMLAWEDGALPKAENFQSWNITPDGLLITFDEYQVMPYAAGPQAVMIPYAKLTDLARPDGPLAPYLK